MSSEPSQFSRRARQIMDLVNALGETPDSDVQQARSVMGRQIDRSPVRAAALLRIGALILMAGLCGIVFQAQLVAGPGLAPPASAAPAAQPTRMRFVATPPDASIANGADFTVLHHMDTDEPGVLMLMAHAGLGDSFPVGEEHQPKIFDVKVVAGDDDFLKLEIHTEKGAQQYDLKRDGTVSVQIAGHKFILAYPSVTVSSADKQTTNKAMIIVNRFP